MRSTLLTFLGLLLLTSCSGREELRHPAAAENLTSRIALRLLKEDGNTQTVGIVVLNPTAVPIQSVRAWVKFDSSHVAMRDFVVTDSRFTLFAPGERGIDQGAGFVKFGGAVREPVSDRSILLATFTTRKQGKDASPHPVLSFFDWRPDGDGHTAVLSVAQDKRVLNILEPPSSFAL